MKNDSIVKSFRLTPELSARLDAIKFHLSFSAAVRRAIERELPVIEQEAKEVCIEASAAGGGSIAVVPH